MIAFPLCVSSTCLIYLRNVDNQLASLMQCCCSQSCLALVSQQLLIRFPPSIVSVHVYRLHRYRCLNPITFTVVVFAECEYVVRWPTLVPCLHVVGWCQCCQYRASGVCGVWGVPLLVTWLLYTEMRVISICKLSVL